MADSPDSIRETVRAAIESEVPLILQLIRELAEFERLSEYVTATEADLRTALFGPRPFAEALMADVAAEPVGYALFYHDFSTFRGKPGIYLEDLYVRPQHRHRGIGKAFMRRLARICAERGCHRLEWSVLNWNEPALRFYRSLGAAPADEWTVYSMDGEALSKLAARSPHE